MIEPRLIDSGMIALILAVVLSGCSNLSNRPEISPDVIVAPKIGYLNNKYRVCRTNCPVRTPKELDDSGYAGMEIPPIRLAHAVLPISVSQPAHSVIVTASTGNAVGMENQLPEQKVEQFDVQFKFGKSIPTTDGYKTLVQLTDVAQKATGNIELAGGTDDIGTQNFNNKLAFARVHFVASWLVLHGVTARVSVQAKGQCCHPSPYDRTETAFQKMRRVQAKISINQEKGGSKSQSNH